MLLATHHAYSLLGELKIAHPLCTLSLHMVRVVDGGSTCDSDHALLCPWSTVEALHFARTQLSGDALAGLELCAESSQVYTLRD